ncbi:LytTR family DNA-binding domain-containing protein [Mucilaginibacter sp. BJC16-A38]|uniref:LytR/AlgR family response regulator transcription factor n=1 Tax=Mucilaginibacter phenanthrenivorans TaxID=1234842 RepID=UPI00215757F9|nr:LytTR family DNA-binding domain-containing protein [Mucilaginibacter phenanthrenivorans]MCR8556167.1 LytTR family DNA-binding domain-containing protein [Mucilaginibacter phenanthrenivorans]
MDQYKCIIIDDEPHAIEGLKNYIAAIPSLKLEHCYTSPVDALMELSGDNKTDLILLDIDMPQISGIELSRQIRQKTNKLVFTTGHTQYGYEAFEVDADAYLLKPYSLSKFASTIAKLFPAQTETKNAGDFFFVKNKNDHLKIVKIRFDEVVAIESKQNYVLIHTLSKQILTYMSLTEISKTFEQLPNFVQYQRSFVLNKEHIESINGNTIQMVNGVQITVGEYYRKDFTAFLSEKLVKAKRSE